MNKAKVFRIRPDLVISPTTQKPGLYKVSYVLIDPVHQTAYQLDEQEMFLCKNLAEPGWESKIFAKFEQKFGLGLTHSDLNDFIAQMSASNLLEPIQVAGQGWIQRALGKSNGDRRILCRMNQPMEVFRPLAYLASHLQGIFVLLRLAILGFGAPCSFIAIFKNFEVFRYDLYIFFDLTPFVLLVFIQVFVFGMASRIAQGVVLVVFGGRVNQAGIQLSYGFLPNFFLEIQNLEYLPRPQQLWALATALIVRLGFLTVATFLWLSTRELDTAIKAIALLVLVANLTGLLLTASPFWRSDGYIWLMSYFRLPHLLERSAAVWEMLLFRPAKGLLAFKTRIMLLVIGIIAAVSFTLLLIAAISIYSFGLGESLSLLLGSHAAIFLLFVLFSGLVLRNLFSEIYRLRSL